jgi:hypothetical protein
VAREPARRERAEGVHDAIEHVADLIVYSGQRLKMEITIG